LINKYTPPQPIKYEKTKAERHQKEKMRYIMKNFKRILSFAIVAIMMLGIMSIGMLAVDTGDGGAATITIDLPVQEPQVSPIYSIYRVFNATSDGVTENISYTTVSDQLTTVPVGFSRDAAGNVTYVGSGTENQLTADDIAAIKAYIENNSDYFPVIWSGAANPDETTLVLENLKYGYYYITTTTGSIVTVTSTNPTAIVEDKNVFPSIDKKQKDDPDDTVIYADDAVNVAVGDKIYYQLTVTVPTGFDKDITIIDILPDGLKAPTTVASDIGAIDTDYTVSVTGQTVAIVIKKETTDTGLRGKTVNFTYSADVEVGILLLTDENKKNAVSLVYSNFTQNDAVSFNTYDAGAYKYAGDINANPTSLAGAQFELQLDNTVVKVSYDETNKYYYPDAAGTAVITSDAEGKIVIRGLDNKTTYSLKETVAPGGYNLPTDPFVLVLEKDSSGEASITPGTAATINIQNVAGTILPSTGGIGTTIFYIVGSILVVGAGIVLITKKRMSAK